MLASLLRRSLASSCGASGSAQVPLLGVLGRLSQPSSCSCSCSSSLGQQAGAARGYTDVSPTLKQQLLFSEMQSVRRMLLLQDPQIWHTEPSFSAHGAHLLPRQERSSGYLGSLGHAARGPSNTKLASIIEAQASGAAPAQPQQQQQRQQLRGRRAGVKESSARHLEQLWQAAAAKGMSAGVREWAPGAEHGGVVPMEMKNLIKVWRRLKMKKHKIRKRRKANRYKNV